MGVPPHAFASAPSRALDNAVSIQGDPPHGPLGLAAIRRNAKKRLPPYLSALRVTHRAVPADVAVL